MFFVFFSICIAAKHGSGSRRHSSSKKNPVQQESEYVNAFAEDEIEQQQQIERLKRKDFDRRTKRSEVIDQFDQNYEIKKNKPNYKQELTKKDTTNTFNKNKPVSDEKIDDFDFEYPQKNTKIKKDEDSEIPDDWLVDDPKQENPNTPPPTKSSEEYKKQVEKQQKTTNNAQIDDKQETPARNPNQPKILLISSDSFTLFHTRKANVTVDFNKDPLDAYCRIDDQIKRGIVYDKSMVICTLPNSILPDQAFISVSFDLKNWSPPEVINTYPSSWMVGLAAVSALIIIMYIRTYIANRPRHRPKGFAPEKFLPLSARQMPNMFVADTLDAEHGNGKSASHLQVENQIQTDFESQQLNNDSQPAQL